MHNDHATTPSPTLLVDSRPELLTLGLRGILDLRTTPGIMESLAQIPKPLPRLIHADLSGITRMDDCGALVILQLRRMAEKHGCTLEMRGVPDHVQELLDFLRLDDPPRSGGIKRAKPGIMTRFGIKTIEVASQAATHVSFVGEVTVTLLSLLRHPGRLRLGDVATQISKSSGA